MSPLFALLWADAAQAASVAGSLTEAQWRDITLQAAQHRLRPLLYHRATSAGWSAPAELMQQWQRSYQRAALRALHQRAELQRFAEVLAAQGLKAIALKGGAFVWDCCPDPALRPMRDLDLLLSPADVGAAARHLAELGFSAPPMTMPEGAKHLAPMVRGAVTAELHLRMFETADPAARRREAAFMARVWARAQPSAAVPGLLESSATDTLLHLIIHAVLDHQFNNGPLLIADMDWLIGAREIDWPLFWSEAETLGVGRACQLALGMGQTVVDLPVEWGESGPITLAQADIERVARLMLVDADHRAAVGWPGKLVRLPLRRWPGALAQMLRRRRGRGSAKGAAQSGAHWTADLRRLLGRSGRRNVADAISLNRWLQQEG